ncbi:MAG: SDR family NAD(P)-dependent oxidoreductase [Clostridia bacterium]|nr:SDR family NAD(P)-dependent oxidoreductase [Clostridia bacterium]
MKNWLQDKYVILSGASSGIGRELCKILIARFGAKVLGIGRNEEKMLSLKTELGENAEHFDYTLFDVSKREEWEQLKERLVKQNIAPCLLINNAGSFPTFNTVLNTNPETFERIMQTNYFSIVYAVNALSPLLSGSGKNTPAIVNIASSAALCTVAGTAAYSASKAAVKSYTEALAIEEKGKKYVGLICPGTTATDLFSSDEHTKNSALDIIAMPAHKMAKKIAKKILKRKRRAVVGWDAKLMNFTTKIMPVKGLFLIRGVMKASKSKVFTEVFDYKSEKK